MVRALILSIGLWASLVVGSALCVLCSATVARADDLTDFESARALYDRQNYAGAVAAFKAMVGTDPPRVSTRLLVLESRKYLAASLLFVGSVEEALFQFRLLLAQEPEYAIDPLAFPTDVVNLFEQVKAHQQEDLAAARAAEKRKRDEELRRAEESVRTERENLARLIKLATESETVTANSRWIASIPFGVGQFQNGHKGLGVALAVLEGLAVTTSIATYIGHQRVANDRPGPEELGETQRIESTWRTANVASFGAFLAFALIGIVDAHVRFVPGRVTSRPRQLPPDLERWMGERKLSSGLFRVHF